jgi:hypothetical protein
MKYAKPLIAALVLAAALADWTVAQDRRGGAAQAPPAAGARPEDFSGRYGILSEKNIFVRNRPATRRGAQRSSSSPRRPEEMMVLTGIALQEGRHVAFIENTATRSTQRLVTGDTILGGKVAAIDFGGLHFEAGDRQTRIAVGRNFLGAVAATAPVASASATTAAAGSPATAPAGNSGAASAAGEPADDAGLSAEERMKRKRQRQLGQ